MQRREFFARGAALAGSVVLPKAVLAAQGDFEVTRSEAEWRDRLSDLEYAVMREEATEPAFSSPLHNQKTAGMYHCRGCDQALYSSEHKFDSGTGWPSFWQAQSDAIETKTDRKLVFLVRTECHCDRCGSHLGHIFDDGPKPTGKRHCINGVSLTFKPADVAQTG